MIVNVKVIPNAKKEGISEEEDGSLVVRIAEKPLFGRANKRLIEVLAKHFNVKKNQIRIIRGLKSRFKMVSVDKEE